MESNLVFKNVIEDPNLKPGMEIPKEEEIIDPSSEDDIKEIFFETIDSTQIYARNKAETLLAEKKTWYVVRANNQTAGIGQKDRKWVSPEGNLMVTYIFAWESKIAILAKLLPQVAAISVLQALDYLGYKGAEMKWINDIMINSKKVGGVLTESSIGPNGLIILVGIGVNVNLEPSPEMQLDQPITSLKIEKNATQDVVEVHKMVKKFFLENVRRLKTEGFPPFLDILKKRIVYLNKRVRVLNIFTNEETRGTFEGLTGSGQARIKLDNQEITILNTGRMFLDEGRA